MGVFVTRKKSRLSKQTHADHDQHGSFFRLFLERILLRLPSAIFVLAFIYIWSSSTTVISGNIVHLCVSSSRKLNSLYCLSAGTQPNLDHHQHQIPPPLSILNVTSSSTKNDDVPIVSTTASSGEDHEKSTNETLLVNGNVVDVEKQLLVQRSWISDSSNALCEGGGIYVYDLPSKFNKDLQSQCSQMIPWQNLCKYLGSKEGLGEPLEAIGPGWYDTHQYALEPIFHSRVLKHPCRVYNHTQAKLFYVPYYGGLDVMRWHFKNVSNEVKDSMGQEVVRWLESQAPWYNNLGKDHVFVLGKITWDFRRKEGSSWGTRFLELDQMQNPIKLLIERHPWILNDVGVPHPTYFHPRTDEDVFAWQLKAIKSKRVNAISFAGAARPKSLESIRTILIEQCTTSGNGECKFLNCSSGECKSPEAIVGLFMESDFCLQPPGDSATRKSVFDSLVAGCIPVVFDPMTAYYQYPWHLPGDRDKYSVFIDQNEVRNKSVNVVERLMKISKGERENMRRYIVYELLPGVVYGDSNGKLEKFQDAFSISINNLLQRVNRLNQDV